MEISTYFPFQWSSVPPPDGRGSGGGGRLVVSFTAMLRNSVFLLHEPKKDFARQLRTRMTPGEIKLWSKLSKKRFHGLKFRKQVPIGPFIVDFLCVEKMLIIEVDGDAHFELGAAEKDRRRQDYLETQGFRFIPLG